MPISVADEYLEAKVMTAPPEELHLMVVDGAIRQSALAERCLTDGDFEASHNALCRAREFVVELMNGLDESQAPQVVPQLKGLFGFAYRRLHEADMHRDSEMIADALKVLKSHRDTWRELIAARAGE